MGEPTREELLGEAYRRGLLPPDMKQAYEEADRRGLLGRGGYANHPRVKEYLGRTYTPEQQQSIDAFSSKMERDAKIANSRTGQKLGMMSHDYGKDPYFDQYMAIRRAEDSGWKVPESNKRSDATSAIGGWAAESSLNFGDEASGAVAGVMSMLQGKGYKEGYRKKVDDYRLGMEMASIDNPGWHAAGRIGGGLSTAAVPVTAVGRPAQAAKTIGTVAKTGRPASATIMAAKDVGKTIGTGALAGGAWGAAAGFGEGDGDLEERTDLAKNYATVGAVAGGAAAPVIRYVGAPLLIGAKRKFFTKAEHKALDAILKRMERSGRSLDDIQSDFTRWSKQGDVPETLAEFMGAEERELLSALVTSHRQTREAAEQVLLERGKGEVDWLEDRFAKSFGRSGDDFKKARREAERARVEDPEPFYADAHFGPNGELNQLNPESVAGLMNELSTSRVAQSSLQKASDYADAMSNLQVRDEIDNITRLVKAGQSPESISVQAADYIERSVNRRLGAARSGQGDAALDIPSGLQSLRDRIRGAIDDSGLGDARSVAAERIRRGELLDEGRKILKPGTDVEDVQAILRGVPEEGIPAASPEGREAFVSGASRAVSDKLRSVPDMVGFADAAKKVASTPAMRAKLDAARPKQLTTKGMEDKRFRQTRLNAELDEGIDRVSNRATFTNDMIGNSRTAFRRGDVESAMADDNLSTHIGDGLSELLVNGPISAVGNMRQKYGRAIGNYMFRPSVYNPKFNEAAREVFLAQGDQIPEQLARLRARQQKRPPVPMTPAALAAEPDKGPAKSGFVPGTDGIAAFLRKAERKLLPAKSDRHYADMLRTGGLPDRVDPNVPVFEQMLTPRPAADELANIVTRGEQRAIGGVPSIRPPLAGKLPIMRDIPKGVKATDGDAQVMGYLRRTEPKIAAERGANSSAKSAENELRRARYARKKAEEMMKTAPGTGSGIPVTPKNRGDFLEASKRLTEAQKTYDQARQKAIVARQDVRALPTTGDESYQVLRQELTRRGMPVDGFKRASIPGSASPVVPGNRPAVDSRMARLMLDPTMAQEAARIAREGGSMNTFNNTAKVVVGSGIAGTAYGANKAVEEFSKQDPTASYDTKNGYAPQLQNQDIQKYLNSLGYARSMNNGALDVDGIIGMSTMQAVNQYERDRDLPLSPNRPGNRIINSETRRLMEREMIEAMMQRAQDQPSVR